MNMIKFSAGQPSHDAISEKILKSMNLLPQDIDKYYYYSERAGLKAAREKYISTFGGANSTVEKCLITHGTLGAIELITRVFGLTAILVRDPTFSEAISVFKDYNVKLVKIPNDINGDIDFEMLNKIIEKLKNNKEKIGMYVIPTLNNPDSYTLDINSRVRLTEVCVKNEIYCLEDNVYANLLFDDTVLPSMYEIAGNKDSNIIKIASLSKILMPGLRTAFVEANQENVNKLVDNKLDFGFSPISSYLAYRALNETEGIKETQKLLKKKLYVNNDILIEELSRNDWKVNFPKGGYFVWVELNNMQDTELKKIAEGLGVDFTLGSIFFINENHNYIRLCAGTLDENSIRKGVKLLNIAREQIVNLQKV